MSVVAASSRFSSGSEIEKVRRLVREALWATAMVSRSELSSRLLWTDGGST